MPIFFSVLVQYLTFLTVVRQMCDEAFNMQCKYVLSAFLLYIAMLLPLCCVCVKLSQGDFVSSA